MKSKIAILALLACFQVQAGLEELSQKLSHCIIGYAQGQIDSTATAQDISQAAFRHCHAELSALHDSIGPDQAQWDNLDKQQQQAITKIRENSVAAIREQLTSIIDSLVNEERKNAET